MRFGDARQHKAWISHIGAGAIWRHHIDISIARAGIVGTKVYKRAIAKVRKEPAAPLPVLGVVGGPSQLTALSAGGHVARPHVEHAVHHEHAAGLASFGAGAIWLLIGRAHIDAAHIARRTRNGHIAHAHFLLNFGLPATSITIARVEPIIVGPSERPVVTVLGKLFNGRDGRPMQIQDQRAGWIGFISGLTPQHHKVHSGGCGTVPQGIDGDCLHLMRTGLGTGPAQLPRRLYADAQQRIVDIKFNARDGVLCIHHGSLQRNQIAHGIDGGLCGAHQCDNGGRSGAASH